MNFEMKLEDSVVLVKDVRVESGVLFATIIAECDDRYYVFIEGKPRKIIVSGTFVLKESNSRIYDSLESYDKESIDFEF